MNAPVAALLELEVLDDVGQIGLVARDAGGLEAAVELLAGRSDEGPAGPVLLVSRLLAHEHDSRALEAFAEDGLRGRAPEVAAATAGGRRTQRLERALLGQERRGVVGLLGHQHTLTR
jgi:hypothetical protein